MSHISEEEASPGPVPDSGTASARTASPIPVVQNSAEEQELDSGNLADLFNREDARRPELNRKTRSCFIGNDLSNCHYLVRQKSPNTGSNGTYHLGTRQFHHKDTSYDLHRVVPDILELPDKKLADTLVQTYFDHINCCWPIIDEEWFMAQYEHKDPQGPPPLALLNAVCLVGAHVLASHRPGMKSLQSMFFHRAKTLVECRHEQDRVVYVQVALLLTWYSDGLEEIVANAWHWIGFATRTAIALGMHRDVTNSNMQPVYKRTYTRLWWVLFQFDTIASASSGRPQVMNLEDSDVPELQHSHFEGTPRADADFAIHQSKLCTIISRTIRKGWALRSSVESRIEAIQEADKALAEFMLQLPVHMHLRHSNLNNRQATLHLTYNNFILLLHRPAPSLRTIGPHDDPVLCGDAIAEISSIFETLLSQESLPSMWFYSNHVLFTAIIYAMDGFGSHKPLTAVKSRRLSKSLLCSLRGLSACWRFAHSLLQLFEERLARLERGGNGKTRPSASAPQGAADLGEQSREASISKTTWNPQARQTTLDWSNMEHQVPGEVESGFVNSQFSNPTITLDPLADDQTPQVNGGAILDGLSLFDDFTLEFLLGETNGDGGFFM
ncbi:Ff.00g116380.m01.CDS01 [Fusarium sp. VM40]|nr:Ff.00g116380.m01.CDS01 [Fusarium sp. VM40]